MFQRISQSVFRGITKSLQRYISLSSTKFHGDYEWQDPKTEDEVVNITYVTRDGTEKRIRGKIGDNVMYLAHRYVF